MKALAPEVFERVRVGPAGWSYPDWKGRVYPAPAASNFDELEYLSSYFNVIEINSTFYAVPDPRTSTRWAERVAANPSFRFTAKVHRKLTHATNSGTRGDIDAVAASMAPLHDAGVLSALLVQFPWSFRDTVAARRRIDGILERLNRFPVAIEVRHGEWARDEGRRYLESTGATICGIDQPVIGDSIRPDFSLQGSAGAYFRLHGRNYGEWFRKDANRDSRYDYLYNDKELAPWIESIARAASSGVQVTVVLNNHFRGQAPANAFEIMSVLRGDKVPAPGPLVRSYPHLTRVAIPGPMSTQRSDDSGWLFDPDAPPHEKTPE